MKYQDLLESLKETFEKIETLELVKDPDLKAKLINGLGQVWYDNHHFNRINNSIQELEKIQTLLYKTLIAEEKILLDQIRKEIVGQYLYIDRCKIVKVLNLVMPGDDFIHNKEDLRITCEELYITGDYGTRMSFNMKQSIKVSIWSVEHWKESLATEEQIKLFNQVKRITNKAVRLKAKW